MRRPATTARPAPRPRPSSNYHRTLPAGPSHSPHPTPSHPPTILVTSYCLSLPRTRGGRCMLPAPLPPHPTLRPPSEWARRGQQPVRALRCLSSMLGHRWGACAPPPLTSSSGLPTHQARYGEGPAWGAQEGPFPRPGAPGFSGPLLPPPPSASMFPKAPS